MDWINVNDRLPENNEGVLIWSEKMQEMQDKPLKPYSCFFYEKFISYHNDHGFLDRHQSFITHWMPLPEPPKTK